MGQLMADLLIRNVEAVVIKRLKAQAKLHHRSLQGELKYLVESGTKFTVEEAKNNSYGWHDQLASEKCTDSAELLRKDRER